MPKDVKGKAPEVKSEPKKETVPVKKAEPKKETAAPAMKAEPKKEPVIPVMKAEPKKETVIPVMKAEPKKETAAVKKPAAKAKKIVKEKSAVVPEVFIQYTDNGKQEADIADIIAQIKALYVAEGHRESSIKSLKVYMKPQEWKAYYVINDKIEGNIMIF